MSLQTRRKVATPTDHRIRVGRERRARTKSRIIEAAVHVFAAQGPDAPVIDDFIRAAGVARGTFYNHYKSTAELLTATTRWLEDDLILSIVAEMADLVDPLERLTLGVRLWLKKAAEEPAWCDFVVRVGQHGQLVERELNQDLRNGLAAGVFSCPSLGAAHDLVVGTIVEAMRRLADPSTPRSHADDVARTILRGLGLNSRAVERAMRRPMPELRRPPHGLG